MSAVWKYFTALTRTKTLHLSATCHAQVSRGATEPGRFNTSNLIAHLKKYLLGKTDCLYQSAYIGDFRCSPIKSDIRFFG